ncbi:MAG: right-handed parallel beta-helix repeat-containing protein, partial [Desulfobulbaceae bacterium]|nr:right-handed parallel beta-helix repeat-containing protein [Desulfobulbaceae bacterium]
NMLDSTGNVIEYCDFSYANTAVHAHSGQASINNCYFHDNGVAVGSKSYKDFATKCIFTLENNRITGNGMGLLFGSGAVMNAYHNEISDNKLFGIYAKKGSPESKINNNNIVKNGKGILFWGVNAGFKILANNIYDNTDYNLSLMEGTNADVDASGNWWGTTDETAIKATVRDKDEEKELGTAIIKGFAQSPIPGAGITN